MVKFNPLLYRKNVMFLPKGESVLYVRLIKALYWILRAVLLIYKRRRNNLNDMGFEISS